MITQTFRKLFFFSILFLLIAFHSTWNYIWLDNGGISGGCDVMNHLENQRIFDYELSENLAAKNINAVQDCLWNSFSPEWTRTVYLISSIICRPFPDTHFFFIWVNGIFFFSTAIIGTFFLGRKLYSYEVGMVSAILVSFCPGLYGLSRKYGLDLPLVSIMPFVILCWIRMLQKTDIKNAIAAGFVSGLAALIRPQVALFLLLPAAQLLIKIKRGKGKYSSCSEENHGSSLEQFLCFLVFLLIAISISALWWKGHVGDIFNRFVSHSFITHDTIEFSASYGYNKFIDLTYYIISLPSHMSFWVSLMVICGISVAAKKEWEIILIWIVPAFIFFSFLISAKWARYLFPIYPLITIIAASGLNKLKGSISKIIFFVLIIIGLISEFFSLSFRTSESISSAHEKLAFTFSEAEGLYAHEPESSTIIGVIEKFCRRISSDFDGSFPIKIGLVESDIFWGVDGCPLIGYLLRKDIPRMELFCDKRYPGNLLSNFKDIDYLIIIEQKPGTGLKIDNLFEVPDGWAPMGEPRFIESLSFRQAIWYRHIKTHVSDLKVLAEEKISPEEVYMYLMIPAEKGWP